MLSDVRAECQNMSNELSKEHVCGGGYGLLANSLAPRPRRYLLPQCLTTERLRTLGLHIVGPSLWHVTSDSSGSGPRIWPLHHVCLPTDKNFE